MARKKKDVQVFKRNDYVRMIPFEDVEEEYGVVLEVEEEYEGMYIVEVHEKFRMGPRDDLLREVSGDQMEYCQHSSRTYKSFGQLTRYECKNCGKKWEEDSSG